MAHPAIRWAVGVAAASALLGLLWFLRAAVFPFLAALGLAFLLSPLVDWGVRRGLARPWAVLLVYATLGVALAALVAFGVPIVVQEAQALADRLPVYSRMVEDAGRAWQRHYAAWRLPRPLRHAIDAGLVRLEGSLAATLRSWVTGIGRVFQLAIVIVLAPVLAFYILSDLPRIQAAGLRWLPPRQRQSLIRYFMELDAMLSGYVRGQLLLALAVAGLSSAALFGLGVPYPLLLGLFAGLGELIPYFGPIAGAVPAVGVALLQSPGLAAAVVVAFFLIQQVESAVVGPFIMRSSLGLHPLVVIFALLAGAELGGLAGVMLALPVTGFAIVTIRFLYRLLLRWAPAPGDPAIARDEPHLAAIEEGQGDGRGVFLDAMREHQEGARE